MKTTKTDLLPMDLLEQMARALRVLGHAQRLRVIEFLSQNGPQPVYAIVAATALPQATISHHLDRMRVAGLITSERKAREIWYRISDKNALTILDCIRKKARNK